VVEQSIMVAEGATPLGPLSDREAVRRLVEEIVQTMLEREFVQFLGARATSGPSSGGACATAGGVGRS
jgi:hypothetical protein